MARRVAWRLRFFEGFRAERDSEVHSGCWVIRLHRPTSLSEIVRIRSKQALHRFRVDENAVGAVLRIHTAGFPHGQGWFIVVSPIFERRSSASDIDAS